MLQDRKRGKYTGYDIIETKTLTIPHTTNISSMNVKVYDNSQYFETPIKHKHGATEPNTQVILGYDVLQ